MIEFFRRNRRGIVGLFIVSMCGLMMLPFGLDQLRNSSMDPVVATVGSKEIRMSEYLKDYSRVRSMFVKQFGAQFDQFEQMLNLKQKVLDDIIDKSLLNNFFSTLGLSVSKSQVESAIRGLPVFSSGVTRENFENFLKNQGISESLFLAEMKESLIEKQLNDLFESAGATGINELKTRYEKTLEKIGIDYVKLPEQKIVSAVTPEEINEYFEKNKDTFVTSRAVLPIIINFNSSSFKSKVVVDEADVIQVYENSDKKFEVERKLKIDQVKFSSSSSDLAKIVSADKDVKDNTEEIKSLSEAARDKLLEDPNFDLKILKSQGATVMIGESLVNESSLDEEIKSAVKTLSKGDVSGVIKTNSDYVIIKVREVVDSYKKPISEVKLIIEDEIKDSLAPEYAKVSAESFIKKLESLDSKDINEKIIQEAKLLNLEIVKPDKHVTSDSNTKVPGSLISDPNLNAFISELPQGVFRLYEGSQGGDIKIIYASDVLEVRPKTIDEVRFQITQTLEKRKVMEATKNFGESLIKEYKELISKNNELQFKNFFKDKKLEVQEIAPERISTLSIPFLQTSKDKNLILSEVKTDKVYSRVFMSIDGSSYIIGLSKIEKPTLPSDLKKLNEELNKFSDQNKKKAAERLNKILVEQLKLKVKPEVKSELLTQ